MVVTLRELSERMKDQGVEALAKIFKSEVPVLVCAPEFAPEEIDGDATMRFNHKAPEDTHSGDMRSPWASLATGESVVVPLIKSERNPFAGVVSVGRREDNDVILKAGSISKLHALFKQSVAGWSLQDNNSKNGTFLNHKRLGKKESVRLKSGDEVGFGLVRAMFFPQQELVTLCSYVRSSESRGG